MNRQLARGLIAFAAALAAPTLAIAQTTRLQCDVEWSSTMEGNLDTGEDDDESGEGTLIVDIDTSAQTISVTGLRRSNEDAPGDPRELTSVQITETEYSGCYFRCYRETSDGQITREGRFTIQRSSGRLTHSRTSSRDNGRFWWRDEFRQTGQCRRYEGPAL